jgi:hypothetical protein
MKGFSKLIGFIIVFIAVMVAFCTVSFAADSKYTDNLIPKMTSSTSPGGIVSASGYDTKDEPYKAFNKDTTYYDIWQAGSYKGWLAYEFTSPQVITKYTLQTTYNYVQHFPKDWTFEVWNGSSWIVLDSRSNITDWVAGVKKEFYFNNSTAFTKYRINISANVGGAGYGILIGEMEMMASIITAPIAPTNLTASAGDTKVDLAWDTVPNAASYNIKRSTTHGQGTFYMNIPVTTTSGAITYTDTNVTPGTTYYYVVSAVNASGESPNSNEASATPLATNQFKLVLEVRQEKQLSVSDELSDNTEMDWTSLNSTIAAIDVSGRVKALKPGNTIITCTSKDKSYTGSINVLVVDLEYQLAVDLTIGGTCRLTIDDLTNTTNVTWSSYDTTIAAVSAKGKVTAVSEGLTYVVATDKAGKEIGRIYIRVR